MLSQGMEWNGIHTQLSNLEEYGMCLSTEKLPLYHSSFSSSDLLKYMKDHNFQQHRKDKLSKVQF